MHYRNSILKKRWTGVCLSLLVTAAVFLAAVSVRSQDKKQTKSSTDDDDVIKVTSNLVSLEVTVKDKKGKAVTDLNREDFTVIENGVAQKIEFFDSTLTTNEAGQPANASDYPPPGSRTRNGLPRNIIALVLDGQSTQVSNLKHVREGIVKYIRERISDSDSVALFSISGGLQLRQPFTQDKERLIAAVENAYDSSTVAKTSEARDISQNISSLRCNTRRRRGWVGGRADNDRAAYARTIYSIAIGPQRATDATGTGRTGGDFRGPAFDTRQENGGNVLGRIRRNGSARLAGAKHDRHRQSGERGYLYYRLGRAYRRHSPIRSAGSFFAAGRNFCSHGHGTSQKGWSRRKRL